MRRSVTTTQRSQSPAHSTDDRMRVSVESLTGWKQLNNELKGDQTRLLQIDRFDATDGAASAQPSRHRQNSKQDVGTRTSDREDQTSVSVRWQRDVPPASRQLDIERPLGLNGPTDGGSGRRAALIANEYRQQRTFQFIYFHDSAVIHSKSDLHRSPPSTIRINGATTSSFSRAADIDAARRMAMNATPSFGRIELQQ
uniref:Uncharacterized protein n=1 Tax=Plectus sambesii TaxID=2011161 RepID=A0A914ULA3_9BILA